MDVRFEFLFAVFSATVVPAQISGAVAEQLNVPTITSAFHADVRVYRSGRWRSGRVIVDGAGTVFVEHLDHDAAAWVSARMTLLLYRSTARATGVASFACHECLRADAITAQVRVDGKQWPAAFQEMRDGQHSTLILSNHRPLKR